jgi:hypothetical protein
MAPKDTRGRFAWLSVLAFVLAMETSLSTLIYGNSAYGVAYLFGQFAFACGVAAILTLPWRGRTYRAASLLAIAGIIAIVGNATDLLSYFEVQEARTALKSVRDPGQIDRALKENPSNLLLRVYAEAFRLGQEAQHRVEQLSNEIEPVGLAQEPNYASATRAELQKYLADLRAAEANASSATIKFIAILEEEREGIQAFAKSVQLRDRLMRDVLVGVDGRHARATEFARKMFPARAEFYRAAGDTIAILIEQFGNYKLDADGRLVFLDTSVVGRFNSALEAVDARSKRVAELEEERRAVARSEEQSWRPLKIGNR